MTDMYFAPLRAIDPQKVEVSPSWVIDRDLLEANLKILNDVQKQSGAKILLALKGFSTWCTFDLVKKYLTGATASSPHEARLATETLSGEVHGYAPAYSDQDFDDMFGRCDHMVFNSLTQWQRFRSRFSLNGRQVSPGLRINPQHSEVEVALYDPCAPRSRLGVPIDDLITADLSGLEGIHMHTLCELGVDALDRTLQVVESKIPKLLHQMKWLNLGGGHHITKPGYDRDRLIALVKRLRNTYGVDVYLEPGEAIAIRTGNLVSTVLDIIDNEGKIAILDISATAHMPDILEMPYRPEIEGADLPNVLPHTYRLGGLTCLAGDIIGDYSFAQELKVGDKIMLLDMSHYTVVKTSNFNGVQLPAITLIQAGAYKTVKVFGYETYRDRLS